MATELDHSIDKRYDREGDEEALTFFSEAERRLSPEEYAARRGHLWLCFSFHRYRYRDPVLGAWVKRVGDLLMSEELEELRERLLSPAELAEVRRQQAEEP